MGKYSVELVGTSKEDLQKIHKSGNKAIIKKIEALFLELSEHPQTGTGKTRTTEELARYVVKEIRQEKQTALHDKRGSCCCLCCLPARGIMMTNSLIDRCPCFGAVVASSHPLATCSTFPLQRT